MVLSSPSHALVLSPDAWQEYPELKRLIFWVLATLIPLTVLTVITGIVSASLAIDAIAIDSGTCIILHVFNMIAIGIILRQNSFSYPYGTGKLENFSGFLYAVIVLPGALLIIASAVRRYLHPPAAIDFGPALALLLITLLRDGWLLFWTLRLCMRYPDHSPMTQSYRVSLKLAVIHDCAILAGLMLGAWLFSSGYPVVANIIDLFIGLVVAIYICYNAVFLLIRNFRSLIDLPLPEADQFKILHALVAEFDAYQGIGNIYSQLSGSTRLIQIELYFGGSTTAEEIEQLRSRLEERLGGQFSKLMFHLIPLVKKTDQESGH